MSISTETHTKVENVAGQTFQLLEPLPLNNRHIDLRKTFSSSIDLEIRK